MQHIVFGLEQKKRFRHRTGMSRIGLPLSKLYNPSETQLESEHFFKIFLGYTVQCTVQYEENC